MKLYTIATKNSHCGGHGDYYDSWDIIRDGGYGTGEYPPVFETEKEANDYLKTLKYNYDKKVVPLNLIKK